MKTWTPLWSSIINSSVWGENKDVKILWITLLALKDKEGFVETSLPGLARNAVLSLDECKAALTVLESPDQHSRTRDNDGRRIKAVDGGWMVLNHMLYRNKMGGEYRKEYQRLKQAEYRARKKKENPLPGESEFDKKLRNGASETQLDEVVNKHLPSST